MAFYIRETEFELKKHLNPNEHFFWTGMPQQGLILSKGDIYLIPFSILWAGFAFFWEYTVIANGAPLLFVLFGLPFVFIGIYMLIGRFFYDAHRRKHTLYGITNTRIIIQTGSRKATVSSIQLKTLSEIRFTEKSDGSGSITFGSGGFLSGFYQGTAWPGASKNMATALEGVPDVKAVYKLINDLQNKENQ